jgi:hypothetical protein
VQVCGALESRVVIAAAEESSMRAVVESNILDQREYGNWNKEETLNSWGNLPLYNLMGFELALVAWLT